MNAAMPKTIPMIDPVCSEEEALESNTAPDDVAEGLIEVLVKVSVVEGLLEEVGEVVRHDTLLPRMKTIVEVNGPVSPEIERL